MSSIHDEEYLKEQPNSQDDFFIEDGDLVLDFDKDEDCWYSFKCREDAECMRECFEEGNDCVGISPRGTFQYCPSLIIVVSADTLKKVRPFKSGGKLYGI